MHESVLTPQQIDNPIATMPELNPRYQRYAALLTELVEQGRCIHSAAEHNTNRFAPDRVELNAWLVRTKNIIELVFGGLSPHGRHLITVTATSVTRSFEIASVVGLLEGALADLEGGFLHKQEMFVAAQVFDSVLEEAKYLYGNGHIQCAAILARVVLEDSIRRVAGASGVESKGKASAVNDRLKAAERFTQPRWRQVQAWLDVGNAAAHGQESEYDAAAVEAMLRGVEELIGIELG